MWCCAVLQTITASRYADDFKFQDPTFKQNSLSAFKNNLGLLKTLFDIKFDVHKIDVREPAEIVTRCRRLADMCKLKTCFCKCCITHVCPQLQLANGR